MIFQTDSMTSANVQIKGHDSITNSGDLSFFAQGGGGGGWGAGLLLISPLLSSAFSQLAFALEVSVSNSRLTIAFGRLEKWTLFIQA